MTPEERAEKLWDRLRTSTTLVFLPSDKPHAVPWIAAEIRAAVEEEREACAEVAQGQANRDAHATSLAVTSRGQARFYHEHMSAVRIAAAIRARGDS